MLISHCICWSSKTCRFVYHVNPKGINNKRRRGGKATNTINKSVKSRESYKRQSRARLAAYYRLLSVHNRWTARQARLSIWLTHCRFTPPPPHTHYPQAWQVHKRHGVCLFFTDTDTLTGFFGLAFHAPLARDGAAWVVSEDRQMFLERDWLNPFETKGFTVVNLVWRRFSSN